MRDLETKVVCRPGSDPFAAAGVFTFFGFLLAGVVLFTAPHRATAEMLGSCAVLALMMWIPGLLFLIWGMRAHITADDDGIAWRFLTSSHHASWEQVSDYYETGGQRQAQRIVVESAAGKFSIAGYWKNAPELRDIIERNADQARAKRWGLIGTRSEDSWPRNFDYRASANIRTPLFMILLGCSLPLLMTNGHVPDVAGWFRDLGIGGGIAVIVLFLFTLLSMPVLLAVMSLSLWRSARRRRDEQISVDPRGITYQSADGSIDVTWDEVEDFWIATERGFPAVYTYVVRTSRGTFDFTAAIGGKALLRAIIARYAVNVADRTWHTRTDSDVLTAPEVRTASGGQVFHYRTRTNRALLWMPAGFAIGPAVGPLAAHLLGVDAPRSVPESLASSGIFLVLAAWAWWRYRAASIEIDDDAITQNTLAGRRRILWRNVEDFYLTGSEQFVFGIIRGTGGPVWFWAAIGNVDTLRQEIARRAVYSRRRTWETGAAPPEERTSGLPPGSCGNIEIP